MARGGVVDERALYEALAARRLHAAGLDVWWSYPASYAEVMHAIDGYERTPRLRLCLGSLSFSLFLFLFLSIDLYPSMHPFIHPSIPQACSTPPSAYPFHELENVVMSPHRGGGVGTPDLEVLRMRHVGRALTEAGRGGVEQMSHKWDFARGY